VRKRGVGIDTESERREAARSSPPARERPAIVAYLTRRLRVTADCLLLAPCSMCFPSLFRAAPSGSVVQGFRQQP